MTPLIDADILLHELGWSGEFKDKTSGEQVLLDFDHVSELLDEKIKQICINVYATSKPILFVTNSIWISEHRHRFVNVVPEYIETFRYSVAKTKPYKGTRNNPKPFHFYNILMYLDGNYDLCISADGYEADDELCMAQYSKKYGDSTICSRDKDLRICPGWHYSWECGSQRAIGPEETDDLGWLVPRKDDFIGYGKKFFYYQMLVGDSADNIPGLPGYGKKTAYKLLVDVNSEIGLYKTVKKEYITTVGVGHAKTFFMEQADLLWMIRERGIRYEIPDH